MKKLLQSFFILSVSCSFATASCSSNKTEDEWRINENQPDPDFRNFKNGDLTDAQFQFESSLDKVYPINNGKKVILFGLDGVKYKDMQDFDVVKNSSINHIVFDKMFDIRGWESIAGWRNVFYGNLWGTGKTIFENMQKMSNNTAISSVTTNWSKFDYTDGAKLKKDEKKVFKKETDLDNSKLIYKNFHYEKIHNYNGYDDFDSSITNSELKELIENIFNYEMKIEQEKTPTFSFFYDTIADDLGHLGLANDDPKVQFVYQEYSQMIEDVFAKYGSNPDYLIIVVTDHGRDPDGKGHSWHDTTENGPRNSWTLSNVNLDSLIRTDSKVYRNLYDVKEVILNWLFQI